MESKRSNIAYTYCIICNITGDQVYIGSSNLQPNERLRLHRSKNNCCRSKTIIDRGDYYFEILETYDKHIPKLELLKEEQKWMDRMRDEYYMNVVNRNSAYISPEQKKLNEIKYRKKGVPMKKEYDRIRNKWKASWAEVYDDIINFTNIGDEFFSL